MGRKLSSKEQIAKLFSYMESFDDDDAPDGAWQAMLMQAVTDYNETYEANYDPNEMFLAYCENKRELS